LESRKIQVGLEEGGLKFSGMFIQLKCPEFFSDYEYQTAVMVTDGFVAGVVRPKKHTTTTTTKIS
jgi:hypothetical protein